MEAYIGELAALTTSLSFSFGSIMFTKASRQMGPAVVNRSRLIFAGIFLGIVHWFMLGTLLPIDAEPERWFWLGLSGAIGFVFGDMFLFQAFALIGPRLTMLMMSLAPILAALQAWLFLRERLSVGQVFGITITVLGIGWVVMEGNEKNGNQRDYGRGILFGLLAAIGQAVGFVLSKRGLYGDFSPVSANLIRVISGVILLWGLAFIQGQGKETVQKLKENRQGTLFAMGGAFTGPFLGVSLSLFALQHIEVGIASTLTALPPVFLLPISYFVFKERFGWGAILGTLLAMAGVAALFLV